MKNGAITVKEILKNPAAMELLKKYFPAVANNSLLLTMSKGMSLDQVISKAGSKVDASTIEKLKKELEAL